MKTLVNKRICTKCGIEKPLTEFYKNPKGKYGRKTVCKKCYNKQRMERYIPVEHNKTHLWTVSAIACLLRHCICEGCLMSDLESGCRMKKEVLKLIKDYGTPFQYKEPTIREEE